MPVTIASLNKSKAKKLWVGGNLGGGKARRERKLNRVNELDLWMYRNKISHSNWTTFWSFPASFLTKFLVGTEGMLF